MTVDDESGQVEQLREHHTEMHRRRYGSPFMGAQAVIEAKLAQLLHDHGFAEAKRGIEIAFTHRQCEWIKTDHVGVLLRPEKWNQHIKPLLTSKGTGAAVRGEQSEFGERPEGKGHRRVW